MQCPVCSGKAQNLTPNTMEGVVVGCTDCGNYRISGVAYYDFMRLQVDGRAAALAAAKQVSRSGWPTISAIGRP